MKYVKVYETETFGDDPALEVRPIYTSGYVQVTHLIIKPGGEIKPHVLPVTTLFYIMKGNGIVEYGRNKKEASADTLLSIPADIPRTWRNEGDEDLIIMVIKAPGTV